MLPCGQLGVMSASAKQGLPFPSVACCSPLDVRACDELWGQCPVCHY